MNETTALEKIADYELRYRGFWDADPEGVCRVRVFDRPGAVPVPVNLSGRGDKDLDTAARELGVTLE